MGFYITLRDSDGAVVRDMPDPFGGVFDASGDFDDLIHEASSPTLAAIDPYAETVLASTDFAGLAREIDALLADVSEAAKAPGRAGAAWRGLTRFRVMVRLCQEDSDSTLHFLGD